jgi:hypothetical protein
MANGGSRTPLIPKFHAENCLAKAKEQSASLRVDIGASSRKAPPDCWKKTRTVRVGGPRVGAV